MTKIFFFCIFFFSLITALPSEFKRVINWHSVDKQTNNLSKSFADFENCIRIDNTGLPYYFESFELNSADANVSISNTVFKSLDGISIDSMAVPNTVLKFTSEIVSSAGKSFLRLTVFPFIKDDFGIEKLVEFTVSLNENGKLLKSATSSFPWKSSSVLSTGK